MKARDTRFLDRVWNLASVRREGDEFSAANEKEVHKTIRKVTGDIDEMKFNTAIAQLMTLVNQLYGALISRRRGAADPFAEKSDGLALPGPDRRGKYRDGPHAGEHGLFCPDADAPQAGRRAVLHRSS